MHIENKVYKNNVIILKSNRSNSIDLEFIENLEQSIDNTNLDYPIIIKGNSEFFCSGLNLKFSHYLLQNELKEFIQNFERLLLKILNLNTITCAVIEGHCIGGGLIMALACDKICLYPNNKKIGLNKKYLNITLPPLPEIIIKNKLSLKNINEISDIKLLNLKNFKLDEIPHNYYINQNNINNELMNTKNTSEFLRLKKQLFKVIYMQYLKNKDEILNNFINSWFKPKSKLKREQLLKSFNQT